MRISVANAPTIEIGNADLQLLNECSLEISCVWNGFGILKRFVLIRSPDHSSLASASSCSRIEYSKPDGKVAFDISTSLYLSGTNHNHDQPPHLVLKNDGVPEIVNVPIYDKPETRYCPAGLYCRAMPVRIMCCQIQWINNEIWGPLLTPQLATNLQVYMTTRKTLWHWRRSFKSTHRTAYIAKLVIWKIPPRILSGQCPKVVEVQGTLWCERLTRLIWATWKSAHHHFSLWRFASDLLCGCLSVHSARGDSLHHSRKLVDESIVVDLPTNRI